MPHMRALRLPSSISSKISLVSLPNSVEECVNQKGPLDSDAPANFSRLAVLPAIAVCVMVLTYLLPLSVLRGTHSLTFTATAASSRYDRSQGLWPF
jgi:hypothetical protein